MIKVAHVINPVIKDPSSDLYIAQPITFESMRVARQHAAGVIDVALFTVQFEEDRAIVPDGFTALDGLTRSVADLGSFRIPRKLPLLRDVVGICVEHTDAEYIVYTNVDIALMPYFYLTLNEIIRQGYDGFVINRRTISSKFKRVEEIPLMYAETGEPHPGFDCFVFRRDNYHKFRLAEICIGINWVGALLMVNLECYSANFKLFDHLHLTFHLGDDKVWSNPDFDDYREFNVRQAECALQAIVRDIGTNENKPWAKIMEQEIEKWNAQQVAPASKPQLKEASIFNLWNKR